MKPDNEFEFTSALQKMFGIDEEGVADLIERLDVDELTDLIDACVRGDEATAKRILGNDTESDESDEDKKDVEDQPLNSLLMKKEHLKKARKDKKNKRILRKSTELGEESNEGLTFNIGDTVAVDGEEATVKIPVAPGDTVGVMIHGELKMVDKKEIHKLDEGVLGVSDMPGLKRMQELAGIPAASEAPPMDDMGADTLDAPAAAPVPAAGEYPGNDMGMGGEMTDPALPAPDMGLPGVDAEVDAPLPVPGAPEVPPAPLGGAEVPGSLEDAAALDQAISDIEAMIPNVKISDFKQVVARLEALVALAKSTGKAALVEGKLPFGMADDFKAKDKGAPFKNDDMKKGDFKSRFDHVAKKKRPGLDEDSVGEDRLSTIRKARDIVSKGGEEAPEEDPTVKDDDSTSEKVPGRKTLMDYMSEMDGDLETLGGNRADAVKALQARMGNGTTPQDANAAFDAMMKDGGIKQNGSAFSMKPMSDDDLKTNVSALKQPKNTNTNTNTNTNSNARPANMQGGNNPAYQGGK